MDRERIGDAEAVDEIHFQSVEGADGFLSSVKLTLFKASPGQMAFSGQQN